MLTKQYNTREAAALCGVKPKTVRKWIRLGLLAATRINPRVTFIAESALEAFIAGKAQRKRPG